MHAWMNGIPLYLSVALLWRLHHALKSIENLIVAQRQAMLSQGQDMTVLIISLAFALIISAVLPSIIVC